MLCERRMAKVVAALLTVIDPSESAAARPAGDSAPVRKEGDPSISRADAAAQKLFEKVRLRIARDLMLRDFEKAGKALEKARDAGLSTFVEMRDLEGDVKRVEEILGKLRKAVTEQATRKSTLELPATVAALGELSRAAADGARRTRVRELDGDVLVLEESGRESRRLALRLLSLPDSTLLSLFLGTPTPERHPKVDAAREDLALLLFYTEGPRRARSLMAAAPGKEATPPGDGTTWRSLKILELRARSARLSGRSTPSRLEWGLLADEYRNLLSSLDEPARHEERYGSARSEFLRADSERLPVEAFFRATSIRRLADGSVRLRYEFDSPDEALDFHPVGGGNQPTVEKRGLVVRGECRLLDGDPFGGTLSVQASVGSLQPEAPNLNIALWTSPEDAVTFSDGETTSWLARMREAPGSPGDYFLFGIGYRAVVARLLERPFEEVLVAGSGSTVKMPANVLLAGRRAQSLHRDLGEGLWAEPTRRISTKTRFTVDWSERGASWSLNGAVLLSMTAEQLERGTKQERQGSFTLITNGSSVIYDSFEVTGALRAEWVAARRSESARVSLDELLRSSAPRE